MRQWLYEQTEAIISTHMKPRAFGYSNNNHVLPFFAIFEPIDVISFVIEILFFYNFHLYIFVLVVHQAA